MLFITEKDLSHAYIPEPSPLYYSFKPNYNGMNFSINRWQTRGKDFSLNKEDSIIRILGVGDSTTFGMGVRDDETFLSLLEDLANKNDFKCEVINAGVPGYQRSDFAVCRARSPS